MLTNLEYITPQILRWFEDQGFTLDNPKLSLLSDLGLSTINGATELSIMKLLVVPATPNIHFYIWCVVQHKPMLAQQGVDIPQLEGYEVLSVNLYDLQL